MTGAARFLNNLYGNLVGTINGFTVEKSVPSNAVFTDTKYTAANAAPGKVASSSSQGSSTNYARQDHTHGIDLATGDSNGQVKIAGTNVAVKGISTASNSSAFTVYDSKPANNATHLISSQGAHKRIAYQNFTLTAAGWGDTSYSDQIFDVIGVYRQAISFAGFTENTEIVSVKLIGSQCGTKSGSIFYDQQFALLSEAETGASLIEFRATSKPSLDLTVVVGYVNETLNTSAVHATLPSNSRYVADD